MSEPKTVPIIDDDHDFVSAIAALLESSGYPVRSAASGRAGKDPAKRIQPGLVLFDVIMTFFGESPRPRRIHDQVLE